MFVALLLLVALGITLSVLRSRQIAAPEDFERPQLSSDSGNASASDRSEAASGIKADTPVERASVGPLHIAGRVVRYDGEPAAGCLIELWPREPRAEGVADLSVIANGNGEFRFEKLAGAAYTLMAKSEPGFVDVVLEIDLRPQGSLDGVLLTLLDARHITVTVVDALGVGVPGASVSIQSGKQRYEHLTDVAGITRETVLGDGMTIQVVPPRDGNRRFLVPQNAGLRPPQDSVRIVLEEAGVATGVVWLEKMERPWSGAAVVTYRGDQEVSRTAAGTDGCFTAVVPIGEPATLKVDQLEFAFRREVAEGTYPEARLDGVRAGDQDLKLVVRLRPADRKLRVVIQDPDGKSIPNSKVIIRPEGRISFLTFDSNEVGVADIDRLPDLELDVLVNPPKGWEGSEDWLRPVTPRVRPVGQEVVIRFSKGVRMRGIVLGPDGEPCPGAHLLSAQTQPYGVVANEEGRFDFLVDGNSSTPINIKASAGIGHKRLSATLNGVDPRGGELVIRLQRDR